MNEKRMKKAVSLETFVTILAIGVLFGYLGHTMGLGNMFNTLMKTAHDLLLNTVFFIMAIAVLAGAFSALLSEFGIVALINYLISPIMKPLYNLPGAASIGAIMTFLSDNPAIISLANDKGFAKYFKNYQLPTLCNLGTAFGMGLIVSIFMGTQGNGTEFILPAALGVLGAVVGSIVSVRIMMHFTKKFYHYDPKIDKEDNKNGKFMAQREIRDGNAMERALEAILDGGKTGVDLGLAIIPGVIVICTLVMIFTLEPSKAADGALIFTGIAYEGVGLLPKLGALMAPVLTPLFGFSSPQAIAFPITSLGSVGAALGMVPKFLKEGSIGANEIAVFTAMGMCWSGYLSTHVGMMDALGVRKLTNNAIFSHTIGGIAAGVAAHYFYLLSQLI